MLTIFEFSQQIALYRKEKKYPEVLTYFRENKGGFAKEQIRNNEYIVSDMITCLRNANHLDAGFQFLNIYGIEINEEQKERILSAYGWLLWAKYKAENDNNGNSATEDHYFDIDDEETEVGDFELNKSELLDKVETLIPILNSLNSDFIKTLSSNLFTIVLKTEKKKPTPNWKLVNEFCNTIDRYKLSKDCSTIKVKRKGQEKDMELASDFENWYAYKTKALMKLGDWQECFDLSKEALEKIDIFHYSNDVWFSRRVALSKRNLGNTEDTIQELQNILKKKREWFIQKELAELYFEKGNIETALKHSTDAMNNFGPLEFKVDLLYLLGKILKQQNKLELSFQHFSLSKLIRQREEWKLPEKLIVEFNSFTFSEISQTDLNKLKNELQTYWDGFRAPQTQTYNRSRTFERSKTASDPINKGEIVKILHDNERGKDGFLKSNNKEFYFSMNPNSNNISKIKVGSKVVFEIKPSTDMRKEQARITNVME